MCIYIYIYHMPEAPKAAMVRARKWRVGDRLRAIYHILYIIISSSITIVIIIIIISILILIIAIIMLIMIIYGWEQGGGQGEEVI